MGFKIKIEKTPRITKEDLLLENIKEAVDAGGWEAAKELCRNTRGKTAFVLYQFIDEVVQNYD